MQPTEDWKPSVQPYADGKYSCRLLRLEWVNGMYIDSGFSKQAKHYDHTSKVDAERCAWEQIAALREERDAG